MGNRLSKIYTRTGDKGDTGLADGSRMDKDDIRIEAIGTIDELNSAIGIVLANQPPTKITAYLDKIQHHLFDLGGELSLPNNSAATLAIKDTHILFLENSLDGLNAELPALKEFILPSGGAATASCHLARSICRRAERRLVTLNKEADLNTLTISYLNRLSDLLFVIARVLARHENGNEVYWQPYQDNE